MSEKLIIVTRGSPLALQQAQDAAHSIEQRLLVKTEIRILTTTGDRQANWSLEKQGGKGLFTAELEQALLKGEADIAIHSAKDLPTEMPAGLTIATCLTRQDPRDVLVKQVSVASPEIIATGSPRRRAQGALLFPKARWTELRGNVDTRLKKIALGEAQASYLAASGLNRLGIKQWEGLTFNPVPITQMVPAAGQGAVAIQCRVSDNTRFHSAGCPQTSFAVSIERLFLQKLGEGCHTAFACHYHEQKISLFRSNFGYREFAFPAKDLTTADSLANSILAQLIPC